MIRHLLLVTLRQDASAEEIEAISAGFERLRASLPEVASLRHGRALQLPGSSAVPADYAVEIDFRTAEDFAAYIAHPLHQEFVRTCLLPVRTGGMSAQIAL